jgi:hypothetical protein
VLDVFAVFEANDVDYRYGDAIAGFRMRLVAQKLLPAGQP